LNSKLYFRKVGIDIGQAARKDWIPHHELALSIDCSEAWPQLELNKAQALLFLKKENLDIKTEEKGWFVVTYNGLGLGWIKILSNRTNNYLPKNWRIRMDIPD